MILENKAISSRATVTIFFSNLESIQSVRATITRLPHFFATLSSGSLHTLNQAQPEPCPLIYIVQSLLDGLSRDIFLQLYPARRCLPAACRVPFALTTCPTVLCIFTLDVGYSALPTAAFCSNCFQMPARVHIPP